MDHLKHLNEAQKKAVTHLEGPLLILAGAGAGKTRVIVHRIAEIIRHGVPPERILAVTFTNKAAREMKERVEHLIKTDLTLSPYDKPRHAPFIGTFHRLSLEIIKAFHGAVGLPARFTIYDRSDSMRAMREAITLAGFDPKQLEPRRVISVIGRKKGDAIGQKEFQNEHASSYIDEAIAEVWGRYEALLKKEKALDFDDILLTAHWLLENHAPAREHFQNAWDYVHVDEYQDTNRVQYEIVKILAERHGNIAAVGDVDQNIYSWRGASIEHIMNFETAFPNAEIILLTENYRSTKTILTAANDAIAKNVNRREKELHTKNEDGEKIKIGAFSDEVQEARFVANESKGLIERGEKPDNIAVLYRANFQSRVLEEAYLKAGVVYQVLGTRFFERKEIKDTLSYIRAALNPDSAGDMMRAIATPSRGIGKVSLAKIINHTEHTLPAKTQEKIYLFRQTLERIEKAINDKKTSDAVLYAIKESGMWHMYEHGDAEDKERLENLKELITVATKYDELVGGAGIERLIEEAVLQSDQDELKEEKSGVKLMTIHAAKGLEFDTVFITGLEEGLFPHERDGSDDVDTEEERRLFYVALTRARKLVYATYAQTRRIFGTRSENTPSVFMSELDPDLKMMITFPFWSDEIPSIT
ncbi:MAG: UvrD-helicase domain-containing protein [Patescibacteria group bacterium]